MEAFLNGERVTVTEIHFDPRPSEKPIKCNFCNKPKKEVHKLVESVTGALICDECVTLAVGLMVKAK